MRRTYWAPILVILSGLVGYILWDNYTASQEGIAAAKSRTQASCVMAVTRGNRVCTGKFCFLNNRYFFQACMDHARKSEGLCQGVKTKGTLPYFNAWKKKKCDALNRTDRTCFNIWHKVAQVCDSGHR